jgi:hypothetical protein
VTSWKGNGVALAVSTDDRRYHWTGLLTHDPQGWHLNAISPPGMFAKH